MLSSFFAIPLMIRYLGQVQFGVWSTLLTVMSWIVFFDLGVGNGLRNKVTEALAKSDRVLAAGYISSGYTLIGIIAFFIYLLIFFASFFISWQSVFNVTSVSEHILRATIQIAALFVVFNFWLGLIAALLSAVQRTSLVSFGQLISSLLALLFIGILLYKAEGNISYLALSYGLSLVSANLILSVIFFKDNADFRPSFLLKREHVHPLLSIGMKFFLIQLAVLVIFTTDKMLITQLFGPQYVTQYEVVFKLFSIITFFHTLISAPLWSAYTDAYHRGDMKWVKNMLKKQVYVYLAIVAAVIVAVILAQSIIKVWIGGEFVVSLPLVITMGGFILISTWNNIFAMFLNGIEAIQVQLYTAVLAMFLNIPIALILVKYFGFGLSGVVIGTCISLSIASVVLPIQVLGILRGKMKKVNG
nr:oligosaccharide flippase family protein [Iodobacter violacea]